MFKEGNKAYTISIIVILALFAGAFTTFLIMANNQQNNPSTVDTISVSGDRVSVKNLTVTVGNQDAPVELTIYEDFGCPHCKDFEEDNKETIQNYVSGEDVKVSYKIVSFMDGSYPDKYPSRAANFMLSVSQHAPEKWFEIHNRLYEESPTESVEDEFFITLAEEAGIEGETLEDISSEVEKGLYDSAVSEASRRAVENDNIEGTPTIRVNDETVSTDDFESAVSSALEG